MEKYVISQELAQRIMNYIVEPHKELFSIVGELQKLEAIKEGAAKVENKVEPVK